MPIPCSLHFGIWMMRSRDFLRSKMMPHALKVSETKYNPTPLRLKRKTSFQKSVFKETKSNYLNSDGFALRSPVKWRDVFFQLPFVEIHLANTLCPSYVK